VSAGEQQLNLAGEPERDAGSQLVPCDQQLGLDGELHDIAPGSERLRLFEPAPAQLPGQLALGDLGAEAER
jgi:hypothetical protein